MIPLWSSHDHIEINQLRYPWYLCDPLSIITNLFLIIEPGLLLSTLLLSLLTHSVTDYELGPYLQAWLSIDYTHTLQRLAHCTHTTEPMDSCSHSGGPMAFRQNWSIAITPSRPLRQTLLWAKSLVAPMSTHDIQRPPSWQNNKRSQIGTSRLQQLRAHKAYAVLPSQGSARA